MNGDQSGTSTLGPLFDAPRGDACADYLSDLNPPQREAVEHVYGPILVLAGAGSGKTRVLTRRIAHLIVHHRVPARRILAVTFTNKATEEMRHRLISSLGEDAKDLWVSTFHSAGLRILRRNAPLLNFTHDFTVYDDDDSLNTIKGILKQMNISEKEFQPSAFARQIDRAKNNFKLPHEFKAEGKDRFSWIFPEVYDRYQKALASANAMDFGDLLVNTYALFKKHPEVLESLQRQIEFVLVDEFQDTNTLQYKIIRALVARHKNLLVVGDDDQSIYSFRGAVVSNILNFDRDFPDAKVVKLEQNYRSTGTILSLANEVIAKNSDRHPKRLWTSNPKGDPVVTFVGYDEGHEADFVARTIWDRRAKGTPYSDIAVLYRTNAQTRAIEEALMNLGIPYRIYGGLRFYDRKEIRDILAYLRLISSTSDVQAFSRILNVPARGIGAQTLLSIANHGKAHGLSLFEAARAVGAESKSVGAFVLLIEEFRTALTTTKLGEFIKLVIDRSGYREHLKRLKDPQTDSRLENLLELESLGRSAELEKEHPAEQLRIFLDKVTLASSAELPGEEKADPKAKNAVSLMTLHLAKGLEFPVVFFTGLEEGLVPHYRSIQEGTVEEERRLCYVGMTRAMKELVLSRATSRGMFSSGGAPASGSWQRLPSRFLRDIPPEHCVQKGGDFFSEGEEIMVEEVGMNRTPSFHRGQSSHDFKQRGAKGAVYPGVFSASQLEGIPPAPRKPARPQHASASAPILPPPPLSTLSVGTQISHTSFGPGAILEINGATDEDATVTIKFERFERPKKLRLAMSSFKITESSSPS